MPDLPQIYPEAFFAEVKSGGYRADLHCSNLLLRQFDGLAFLP